MAGGYTSFGFRKAALLGHSDPHSCPERYDDEATIGNASPQASTQESLWLLMAAAAIAAVPLGYGRLQMKGCQLNNSEDQSDNHPSRSGSDCTW